MIIMLNCDFIDIVCKRRKGFQFNVWLFRSALNLTQDPFYEPYV